MVIIENIREIVSFSDGEGIYLVGPTGWVNKYEFVTVERDGAFWLIKSDSEDVIARALIQPGHSINNGFIIGEFKSEKSRAISFLDTVVVGKLENA